MDEYCTYNNREYSGRSLVCWISYSTMRYGLVLFLILIPFSPILAADKEEPKAEPYNSYYYNYPHSLPPDYVYRTGRLFTPRPWWNTSDKETEQAVQVDRGMELKLRVRDLAKQLLQNAVDEYDDDFVLIVSTFVNLENLYETSALGRYFSEQLINELQLAGIRVIDVRKSPGIMIKETYGEYAMSRDMDELSFVHSSHAMIVGTYTFADGEIFVNARMLRNSDGMVLSSASLVFGLDSLSKKLLADESVPVRSQEPVQVRSFPGRQ